jgi:uncharacterized protein YodC (DUF2158 family)
MSEDFEIGDTVLLKTGSPAMTVQDIQLGENGRTRVECVWFLDETKNILNFDAAMLENRTKKERERANTDTDYLSF